MTGRIADLARGAPPSIVYNSGMRAGFGGLTVAMGLRLADVDVTVIDPRIYHLFQPLL